MTRENWARHKNREVSVKLSIIVFSLTLLVSVILGLSLRHWIYSNPLAEIIAAKLEENKDYPMQVENVQFQFRKGWLPALAISAQTFAVHEAACPARRLLAKRVFISLNLIKLFEGHVVPKKVLVSSLVATMAKSCQPSAKVEEATSEKKAPQIQIKKGKKSKGSILTQQVAENVFKEYQKVFESIQIPVVKIKEFQFLVIDEKGTDFKVSGRMDFRTQGQQLAINIYPNKIWVKEKPLPVNQGLLSLSLNESKIGLHFDILIREGRLNLSGAILNDPVNTTQISVDFIKIPISAMTNFLLKNVQFQYLWANCQLSLSGAFSTISKNEFSLDNCELNGPYGTARVKSSKMTLEKVKLLTVEFDKMDLDKVFKSKRDLYMSGIFSSYGVFSAVLFLDEKKNWNLDGNLLNSELLFSRNNFRELQKIPRMPFQISGSEEKITFDIKDVEIDEGRFDGQIGMSFSEDKTQGRVKVALNSFALKPKIYKLMFGGSEAAFSIFGNIKIDKSRLVEWSGVVAAEKVVGKDFELSGAKIELGKKEGRDAGLRASIQKGFFAQKAAFVQWVSSTTLENQWGPGAYDFKEFSVKVSLPKKNHWIWKRAYARLDNGWQISSEGELKGKFDLAGWLQWDIPEKQFLRWDYNGTWQKGKWSPQQPWMKTWLKSNPEFISDNPRIEFIDLENQKADDVSLLLQRDGQ